MVVECAYSIIIVIIKRSFSLLPSIQFELWVFLINDFGYKIKRNIEKYQKERYLFCCCFQLYIFVNRDFNLVEEH